MGEMTARVQAVSDSVEKAIVEQVSQVGAVVDGAVDGVNKLQAEGVNRAGLVMKSVRDGRALATEKLVLVRKITGEWGKQVMAATGEWGKQVVAATRTAADAFTKKA
jgi:hypothetical protein